MFCVFPFIWHMGQTPSFQNNYTAIKYIALESHEM